MKLKPGFHIVFEGLYGSLSVAGFAESLFSFAIAEGLSGSLRVVSFVFVEVFQGRWNRTYSYLSGPQRLSLSGSLTVFADLSVIFPLDLS